MRLWLLFAAVVSLVVVSGCRAEVLLDIELADDGRGVVTLRLELDAAAVASLPDLSSQLRTDDLTAAGWQVQGPDPGPAGSVVLAVSRGFVGTEELAAVLAQIEGPGGLFPGAEVDIISSTDQVDYRVAVEVDLDRRLEDLADADLAAALGGEPLGRPRNELAELLGDPPESALAVGVTLRLPGGVVTSERWSLAEQGQRRIEADSAVVDTVAVDLRRQADDERRSALLWAGGLVVVWLLVAGVLLVRRERRRAAVTGPVLVPAGGLRARPAAGSTAGTAPGPVGPDGLPAAAVQPVALPDEPAVPVDEPAVPVDGSAVSPAARTGSVPAAQPGRAARRRAADIEIEVVSGSGELSGPALARPVDDDVTPPD